MSNPLAIETWTEYGVGMSFLAVRLYARIDVLGVRNLQLDDFFTVIAMIFWTLQTVIIHYLEVLGNNIGFDDESAMLIPESDVPDLTLGSKLAFINWIWYPCFLWSLKGVMLCLYHRLTEGTRQHKLVLLMAGLVAITWVTCFITHMALCQPLARNWQVKPYPGDNCTIRQPNYLVVAVGNVITDIGIMLTALPLLFGLKVSLPRKIILGVMFSSGIFVMICAILRVYFSFQSIQNLSISLEWATRESFVASVIVSLPGIKPLFRHTRWFGSSGASKGIGKSPYPSSSRGLGGNTKTNTNISSSRHDGNDRPYELRSGFGNSRGAERLPSGDSEEHILASSHGKSNAIHVTTEYEIGHQSHH